MIAADSGLCHAGTKCRAYDHARQPPGPAYTTRSPLCDPCLDAARRDVEQLPYDYAALEQQLPPSLGQWADGQPGSGGDQPAPIRLAPDALQREIWWTTTTWEACLRDRDQLADTSPRTRHGHDVQRAVTVIAPRLPALAQHPAVPVLDYPLPPCPQCAADDPQWHPCRHADVECVVIAGEPHVFTAVAGWQAVLDLMGLHTRARHALGITRLVRSLPGWCPGCLADSTLRQANGSDTVTCEACGHSRPFDEYDQFVKRLVWPAAT